MKKRVMRELKTMVIDLFPAMVKTADGDKWGYINSRGKFRIQPQFDYAMEFQGNGLAVVQVKNRNGVINQTGTFVVKPKYDTITQFSEGRAAVIDSKGFQVIDESGNILTNKAYSFVGMYQEGRALFSDTDAQGKYFYGYLDRQGREVIPLQYESGDSFKDGKAVVQIKEGEYALIGRIGERLYTYMYPFVGNWGDGLGVFKKDLDGKSGYIGEKGNVVIQPQYTWAQSFEEERAVVNISDSYINKIGLIDKQGNYMVQPEFDDIMLLGEKRAAIGRAINPQQPFLGFKYAIATTDGEFLTDFMYSTVLEYKNGIASASDGNRTFFINTSGKVVQTLPIVSGDGTLSVEGDLIKANVDLRIFYLDRSGKVVWKPNAIIPLRPPYRVREEKYKPNKNYIVYYPQIEGMKDKTAQHRANQKLIELSQVKPVENEAQMDYSYTGDFSVEFFKKHLLVLELDGYNYPFGAAHGMPSKVFAKVDLLSGRFYELKDLFKPNSNYVRVLSDIIGNQIKNNKEYSYVFPDSYKGITADQPFYVTEDALYIYFLPYEIAPFAAGFPTFKIPYAEIMDIIDVNGRFWKSFH